MKHIILVLVVLLLGNNLLAENEETYTQKLLSMNAKYEQSYPKPIEYNVLHQSKKWIVPSVVLVGGYFTGYILREQGLITNEVRNNISLATIFTGIATSIIVLKIDERHQPKRGCYTYHEF